MKYQLNGTEARVIGCLLEKQVTTPEQYPLSVNAVTMACNQKTNREPVMNLSEQEVEQTLEGLAAREDGPYVVRLAREPGKRESRYMHLFCGDVDISVTSPVTDITADDDDLVARVEALEGEVAGLKQRLDALLAHLGD